MELKYCELCGGLLLRRAGSAALYCADCAVLISDLAPRRPAGKRGRRSPVPPETVEIAPGWAPPSDSWPTPSEKGIRLEAMAGFGVISAAQAAPEYAAASWGAA
jgi:hypothetical protein